MPNTICAFYIALILKGGGVYGVYHIPGREANPIDKTIIKYIILFASGLIIFKSLVTLSFSE